MELPPSKRPTACSQSCACGCHRHGTRGDDADEDGGDIDEDDDDVEHDDDDDDDVENGDACRLGQSGAQPHNSEEALW